MSTTTRAGGNVRGSARALDTVVAFVACSRGTLVMATGCVVAWPQADKRPMSNSPAMSNAVESAAHLVYAGLLIEASLSFEFAIHFQLFSILPNCAASICSFVSRSYQSISV